MKTLKNLTPILIFTIIFTSCNKDDDTPATLTQRDILIALFNANPRNTLGWDIATSDISTWTGVTTNANGNVIELKLNYFDVLSSNHYGYEINIIPK